MLSKLGVLDRLLDICRFARSQVFNSVEMGRRTQIESALRMDQQQLESLYQELCQGDWCQESAFETLLTSCELGLAACAVIQSVLWDFGGLSSYREAEGALLEARSLYQESLDCLRGAAQDLQVFA